MDEPMQNGKVELLCKVCGDKASGKHYGVSSCDGCRGFFKRSIRRNLEYVCKENGRCIVDVTRRNQCQACRFRKCLHVNMKRDAVQHERAPRTSGHHHPAGVLHHYPLASFAPRLRGLPTAATATTAFFAAGGLPLHAPILDSAATATLHSSYLQQGLFYPSMLQTAFGKPLFNNATYTKPLFTHQPIALKEDEVSSSEEATQTTPPAAITTSDVVENNTGSKRLELPMIVDGQRNRLETVSHVTALFPAENIYESAAKLLFLSIKWARSIPSFLQLSYRDQSILLEESWTELFILTAAQWALPIDEGLLVTNAIAPNTRQAGLEDDARKLHDVITRLTLLRVDHTEHACLKALVLFKAECRGLCDTHHVEMLQDQTHVMLNEYCSQRHGAHKGRFGKLLLTLPAVQSVGRRGLEELLFKQTVGDVAIDRLLGDLAKVTQSA